MPSWVGIFARDRAPEGQTNMLRTRAAPFSADEASARGELQTILAGFRLRTRLMLVTVPPLIAVLGLWL